MPRKYSKKSSYKSMKRIAKQVMAKNIETKVHTAEYSDAFIGANSTAYIIATSVVDIAGGTKSGERVGERITATSLKYDLFFTGAQDTNSLRVIFYIPKSPTDLLWQGPAGTNLAFNQAIDFNRYTVLKDMFIPTNLNGQNCVRKQGYISFRNKGKRLGMPVIYDTDLSVSCTKNRIMVYMVSDSVSPITTPKVNGYVRLFYKDA